MGTQTVIGRLIAYQPIFGGGGGAGPFGDGGSAG